MVTTHTQHAQATSADAASGSDATALGAGNTSTAARTDGTPSRSDDCSTRWLPAPEPLPRCSGASLPGALQVRDGCSRHRLCRWQASHRCFTRPHRCLTANRRAHAMIGPTLCLP